ncbi:MAG: hypothetical protein IKE91_03185 [Clostridia bacterium]|nr:hypothetical protein [Clostridia bacterium]
MANFDPNNARIKKGKLTPEQANLFKKLANNNVSIGNLDEDLSKEIITPKQLAKAVLNPNNVRYNNAKDYRDIKMKIKFEDGVNREYIFTDVLGLIQRYIKTVALEPLSNVRLAYLRKYDPQFQLPEKVDKETIDAMDESDKRVDADVDKYIVNREYVVQGEEGRKEYTKLTYERFITESFLDAFFILHAYKKSFGKVPNKEVVNELITKYADGLIEFCIKTIDECTWVANGIKYGCISTAFRKYATRFSILPEALDLKNLTDDEVIQYIEEYFTREEFEGFIRECGDSIIDRKKVVKYITSSTPEHDHSKAGMFSMEEFKQIINKETVFEIYKYGKDKELLQYMLPEQLLQLYFEKEIELKDLRKYVTVRDILNDNISIEKKIGLLLSTGNTKCFEGKESEKIWLLFENSEISLTDLRRLEEIGYLSIEDIVKQYMDNRNRVIASEMGEIPTISEEKLLEYHTPETILKISRKHSNVSKVDSYDEFYKNVIHELYRKNERDLEDEIATLIKGKSGLNAASLVTEGFLLYRDSIVSIDILRKFEASEDDIVNYCKKHKSNTQLIIDVFNAGLVQNLTMFEEVLDTDFDYACKLIKQGMNARIIQGFETTTKLIEMTRPTIDNDGNEIPPKLSYQNLAQIIEDIDIGLDEKGMTKSGRGTSTLLELYLTDRLTYSELYGLADAGVISIEVANEINEKYGIIKDWNLLKEKGVEGSPIEDLTNSSDTDNSQIQIYTRGAVGIDGGCILDLYIALGATEYLEIDTKKCPVFKDYVVIPVMDKKVAYLEGKDGRTYIVPLKIVLEQINNPNGTMDLMGNATSRKEFNRNKKYIRSANHTRNWGRKVVMKTADLPSVPMDKEEAKAFIMDNLDIIRAIESSYDARKYAKVNQGNDSPEA